MTARRLKILVSAYGCNPEEGSESYVGWNLAREVAKHHEVWLLTRANNRAAIEAELARKPAPGLHILHMVYFDLPPWAKFWKRGPRGVHGYYYIWQLGAYFVAKKLQRRVHFDFVHHLTFVNYWMPSLLALLPVPFIWGPVGGGDSTPRPFWRSLSLRGKIYEAARALARSLGELDPFVRLTARRAAVALATTNETAIRLRALGCRRVCVYSQVGLASSEIRLLAGPSVQGSNRFRICSVGNLLHLKGFDLGLKAFSEFHNRFPASEYWLIGDGPERQRLERLAGQLGLDGCVKFWGKLPRPQVFEKLAECHVLLHPGLHDSGGFVCAEAMAAGLPVICLDLGGPGLQVTEGTGVKLPAMSPQQVVSDLAAALSRLAGDLALRARMGQAARERVEEYFEWKKKGEDLVRVYGQVPTGTQTIPFTATRTHLQTPENHRM